MRRSIRWKLRTVAAIAVMAVAASCTPSSPFTTNSPATGFGIPFPAGGLADVPHYLAQVYPCDPLPVLIHSFDLTLSGLDPSVQQTFEVWIHPLNAIGYPVGTSTYHWFDTPGTSEVTFEVPVYYGNPVNPSGCFKVSIISAQSIGGVQLAPFRYELSW